MDALSVAVDKVLLHRLCELVGMAAVASRESLRSLRLSGPLHLGVIFQMMAPWAAHFTQLEVRWKLLGWGWGHRGQILRPYACGAEKESRMRRRQKDWVALWRPRHLTACTSAAPKRAGWAPAGGPAGARVGRLAASGGGVRPAPAARLATAALPVQL